MPIDEQIRLSAQFQQFTFQSSPTIPIVQTVSLKFVLMLFGRKARETIGSLVRVLLIHDASPLYVEVIIRYLALHRSLLWTQMT